MDRDAIIETFESGDLLQLIFRSVSFAHGDEKAQIQATCVELHNDGRIDLLGILTADTLRDIKGSNFFVGQHFYDQVIPLLQADVEEMMRVVNLLVETGGSDLAANVPNEAFRKWCEADLTRAQFVIEAAKADEEIAIKFLTFALSAKGDVPESIRFVDEYSDTRRLSGIVALGRMAWEDRANALDALSVFSRALQRQPDDGLRTNVLMAALDIATKADIHSCADVADLVATICESPNPATLFACARAVSFFGKTLDGGVLLLLLGRLKTLDPQDKGTVETLDHALSLLLNSTHSKHALTFAEELLVSTGDQLDLTDFDSFSYALLQLPPVKFNEIFVSWMISGIPSLCRGLSSLLASADRRETPLDLSLQIGGLSSKQKLFLCRKAIGYLFLHPIVAASVLVSVLRTDLCRDTATEVRNLLFNPLLLNYEGSVREFLQTIAQEDISHPYLVTVIEENQRYLDGLHSTGAIKEIEPTEHQRQVEMLRNNDQARQIHKDAMKKSILHDLVSHSVVLYGRRTLAYLEGPNGKRTPFEMDLQEHGMSIELPRMDVIDPIGLDCMIRVFRVETLKP
jgi:hypothetical protein